MNDKRRTSQQNKAMWVYLTRLSEQLNDAGLDMRAVLKPGVDIPWTKQSAHDQLWIPIQEIMTGKASTTEMDTVEPSRIYEVLNRHIAEKFGVSIPWPSDEPPMMGDER